MDAKHTPGPWTFEPCHTEEGARYYHVRAGPLGVADTYHADPITVLGYGRYAGHIDARHSNPADAFLIAAAPDLLAALELTIHVLGAEVERTRDAMDRYPDDPNGPGALADDEKILSLARAAIAKARGGN